MAGITERNQQKIELANTGFSMKYIDEWQPKTVLYRHKASLNVQGEVVRDVGTTVEGVPGNPDYVLRKSKIGLFPWKPNETCECKWCSEADWEASKEELAVGFCDICGLKAEAKNSAGVSSKITFHKRAKHNEDV
jgi:hypothetical protein